MSIELLELAVDGLGELTGEVVFVGGATLVLWVTDPGAPPIRPTEDVDVIVEVTTRTAFHSFEERLRRRSFTNDQESGVICRWRHRSSGLVLDAMPADARLLGFENRWQGRGAAARHHALFAVRPRDQSSASGVSHRNQARGIQRSRARRLSR
jgi:predicted GNAT superfamily acetyltransferase